MNQHKADDLIRHLALPLMVAWLVLLPACSVVSVPTNSQAVPEPKNVAEKENPQPEMILASTANEPVGVMAFKSPDQKLGEMVAANILVDLAKSRSFTLVERSQLDKALEEIANSQSGNISSQEVLKIGKMSGAKYLVIGELEPQDNSDSTDRIAATRQYTANMRIIKTETGVVVGADRAVGTTKAISNTLSLRARQMLGIYLTMNNPDSPYSILMKLDKGKNPVYSVGEKIKLTFKVVKHRDEVSDTVYIQVYSIDARGNMTMIYPNKFAQSKKIQLDKEYNFPADSDDFEWELVPPVGTESIQAIVTDKPVEFFRETREYKTELFPSIKSRESPIVYNAIRVQIKKEKLKNWSAERITYKLHQD